MITIRFNEEIINLKANSSLKELLENKGIIANFFAVAINQNFIPKSHYAETKLNEGDMVDIILPMQGG